MSDPTQVPEPNFEGEEMKLPDGAKVPPTPKEPVLTGPIIVLLLLILLSLLGGLYYWSMIAAQPAAPTTQNVRPTADQNREPETPTAIARTQALDVVSTSDDLGVIEADLLSTNLDELDLELTAIETELNAALEAQ